MISVNQISVFYLGGTDGRWQFCWEEVGTRIYIGNYIIYYIIIIYIIYILYI